MTSKLDFTVMIFFFFSSTRNKEVLNVSFGLFFPADQLAFRNFLVPNFIKNCVNIKTVTTYHFYLYNECVRP